MQQKAVNKRRTFAVRQTLIGKLGPAGYGQLLQRLEALAAPNAPKERA